MTLVDDITRRFARSPIKLVKMTVRSTVPASSEGFGAPTKQNKAMTAIPTTIDGDPATATPVGIAPLQSTPAVGSYITVKVGGTQVSVGDGVKTKFSYFSGDAGATARLIKDIQVGDCLHWNGSIAGYQLTAAIEINFLYFEFVEDSDDPTPDTVFFFSPKGARSMTQRLSGVDVRPYLLSDQGRPTRIKPDQALTERASMSLTFHEDEDAPDLPSDRFLINTGGGFFRRLIAAQPDIIGTEIEVLRGFDEPGFALSDFVRIFKGRWEDHNFQANGNITVVAKDDLALNDREIPAQISDTNLLAGDLTAISTTIPVGDASEFTDPQALPSRDYAPTTVRIGTEDIIFKERRLTTDELVVQDSDLDKSEDLSSAPWALIGGASVVTDTGIGPFGGLSRADTLVLPSVTDAIEQNSTRQMSDAFPWTFALWFRSLPADGTITIEIESFPFTAGTKGTIQVAVTNSWKRFEIQNIGSIAPALVKVRILRDAGDLAAVEVFGSALYTGATRGHYVFTDGNAGIDAGRGAFQTTAAVHSTSDPIIEVGVYRQQNEDQGVHPVMALRDLVNRGDIAIADVDQSTFDREQDFIPSSQVKRAGLNAIIEPEKLSSHIKQLREQTLLDLWVSETGLVRTRLSFRVNLPGSTLPKFTDEESILRRSASMSGNAQSRVTRMYVYFDQIPGTAGKDREDYNKAQGVVDLAVESLSGPKTKSILARWLFRDQDAVAVAGRTVSRFRRGARIYKFKLDLKDVPDFDVADLVVIDSTDFLTGSGSQAIRDADKVWQVVQRVYNHEEGTVNIEALEANGRKFAIISPSPFPDFPAATAAERQFGFIGTSPDNLVNVGTEEGYFIL